MTCNKGFVIVSKQELKLETLDAQSKSAFMFLGTMSEFSKLPCFCIVGLAAAGPTTADWGCDGSGRALAGDRYCFCRRVVGAVFAGERFRFAGVLGGLAFGVAGVGLSFGVARFFVWVFCAGAVAGFVGA